jgi:hypothetical protein
MGIIFHLLTAAVTWGIATSAALSEEKTDTAMNTSKQTIDRLVERLATVELTVEKIAHSLGSAKVEKDGKATARMDAPPFEGADIEEFRGVIKINFRLAAGTWRLQDITDKPELWPVGPALPDTGRIDAHRDWDWKHVTIRCIARVQGGGSVEARLVREVRCQVRPRKAE